MDELFETLRNALLSFEHAVQLVREQKASRARYLLEVPDGDFELALQDPDVPESYKHSLRAMRDALTSFYDPTTKPLVDHMVDRFLGWKLPEDFSPDAGISFEPRYNIGTPWPGVHAPTGTNLFHAGQAKAMFEYVLKK